MLYFVTSNKGKILHAHLTLDKVNIPFEVKDLPITEIQSTSIEEIARHKAKEAFKILRLPLVVKDDGWFVESLNGFPGPFMKYVNNWLTVDDVLNLMKEKTNRKITFYEVICYIDKEHEEIFVNKIEGKILDKPNGNDLPFSELSTFRKDGLTMAKSINEKIDPFDNDRGWASFAQWYKQTILKSS
jgi:XTP/dITP diphosphohydrolase